MKYDWLDEYLLSLPGAEKDYKAGVGLVPVHDSGQALRRRLLSSGDEGRGL